MEAFIKFITQHPEIPMFLFWAAEKIVRKSKWKWDDIFFDMLIDPIKNRFLKRKK